MRDWIINILAVWFALVLSVVAVVVLGLFGRGVRHPAGESWDQENLHRNETICPNSTYYAPGGVLTECP